jgi:DNA modification methylase
MREVPNSIAALVVSSPPYNIGKPYETKIELGDYLKAQKLVIKECVRVLRPGGSLCWQVGNYVDDGEVFPLDIYFYRIFKSFKLKLRNRIIWRFGHGLHAQKRFSGRYEVILWFTKGDGYLFNLDSVRVPQKYPGKRVYKGPMRGKPASNPNGMNPSDFWDFLSHEWEEQVWDIPNVKANHPEKTIHPAQFPIELVQRLVLAFTTEFPPHNLVLDPYSGVGSTLVAAALLNRKAIGVDNKKVYTDIAVKRVVKAYQGKLRVRPIGRPIFVPRGTEKVATRPPEWDAAFRE